MQTRRLTESGIIAFRNFLVQNPHREVPEELVNSQEYSHQLRNGPSLSSTPFENRYDFGVYLVRELTPLVETGYQRDIGLWSWLALFYFNQICPIRQNGRRRPSRSNYYILEPHDYTRYYHHMVRTPYMLVSLHGKNAEVLLTQPLSQSGEIVEQLASRQEVVTNKSLIAAVSKLYLIHDENGQAALKRGSAGKNTGGTFRRLAEVMGQFDLTYDFRSMSADDIISILPGEFDKFRSETTSTDAA